MATKLGIYNLALAHLGERELSSLSEAREPRRVLDNFYDTVTGYCLERGYWNWAMRAVRLDASDDDEPAFGYTYAFTKPSDWVRTHSLSDSETYYPPLLDVVDEGGFWYANCDPLYLRYVSDSASWGMSLSLWPESYADYVSLRLAVKICKRITGSEASDKLLRDEARALAFAKSKDAMDEPPAFPPSGTWVNSRQGGVINRSRWNRSS